jgi:Family of unknown function (DUF5706)
MTAALHRRSAGSDGARPDTAEAAAEHALDILKQTARWVAHADGKASLTLASAGVTGGVLYSVAQGAHRLGLAAACAAGVCTLFILAAGLSAVVALWPRVGRLRPNASLLYFQDIAREYPASATPYAEALLTMLRDPRTLADEAAHQIWAISHVAARKYTWANCSLGCLSGGLLMLGVTCALVIGP